MGLLLSIRFMSESENFTEMIASAEKMKMEMLRYSLFQVISNLHESMFIVVVLNVSKTVPSIRRNRSLATPFFEEIVIDGILPFIANMVVENFKFGNDNLFSNFETLIFLKGW